MITSLHKYLGSLGIVAAVGLSAGDAEAKARFMELPEAVESSAAIGVVHTEATAECEVVGEHWTWRQKAFASPVDIVKGELTSPFEVLAAKDFICASERFEAPADYLVFLAKDSGHWVPVNHFMGVLAIDDAGQVEWPYDEVDGGLPLPEALDRIRALVGEPIEPAAIEPAVIEPAAIEPAAIEPEPMPCGYAMAHAEEEAAWRSWQLPLAIAIGSTAMLLGIVVGFRRRRRRR